MDDPTTLDPRLTHALRKWFLRDIDRYAIPAEAHTDLILTINLAFHEGISHGIDLGSTAALAGIKEAFVPAIAPADAIAHGTREAIASLPPLDELRDRTGIRRCDHTRTEEY